MKFVRFGLISLGCVAGALAFGVVANAAIDLVMPPVKAVKQAEIAPATPAEQPAKFALASAEATPADIGPLKIKTIPILVREGQFTEQTEQAPVVATVPLPRPRPAGAPTLESTASVARQPGSLAIAAATKTVPAYDADPLSPANIDRMRTALALTAEQEEFWPAIAVELRAIGKTVSHKGKGQAPAINVDPETKQRLYWAAAPLITRLSYEQKMRAKQLARMMGLNEVAEAL